MFGSLPATELIHESPVISRSNTPTGAMAWRARRVKMERNLRMIKRWAGSDGAPVTILF